jgi:hypothetical protein
LLYFGLEFEKHKSNFGQQNGSQKLQNENVIPGPIPSRDASRVIREPAN